MNDLDFYGDLTNDDLLPTLEECANLPDDDDDTPHRDYDDAYADLFVGYPFAD